jgi:hypothetical protein
VLKSKDGIYILEVWENAFLDGELEEGLLEVGNY